MELLIIITVLSIFLSALLPPCASQKIDLHLKPSLQPQVNGQKVSFTTLPRKPKLTEQVQEKEGRGFTSYKKQQKEKHQVSGKQELQKQTVAVGGKGEWVEIGDDPSQYFTMDYSRARRGRRPIHNKHLPVGP